MQDARLGTICSILPNTEETVYTYHVNNQTAGIYMMDENTFELVHVEYQPGYVGRLAIKKVLMSHVMIDGTDCGKVEKIQSVEYHNVKPYPHDSTVDDRDFTKVYEIIPNGGTIYFNSKSNEYYYKPKEIICTETKIKGG